MQYRLLTGTDMNVSIVGYGASPLGGEFGDTDKAEGRRAVDAAIDCGINYFDTSPYYGRTLSEERLGEFLQGKRKKVYLATKCGRYGASPQECDYSAARVKRSIDESLARLRTDYVDLLQVHDIEMVDDPDRIVGETLPALRDIQRAGKCRFVGITGLPLKLLRYVLERAEVDTVLSFCRYNLMIDDLDTLLAPAIKQRGVGLVNASPLHMRILTEKGAPDWHPADQEILAAGRKVVDLCNQAGVDVADVALRYCLDYPLAATTLVGMSKRRHVEKNVAAVDFEIPEGLLDEIAEAVAPVKNRCWTQGRPENNDPNWSRS